VLYSLGIFPSLLVAALGTEGLDRGYCDRCPRRITNTGGDYFWMTFLFAAVIWLSIYLILRRFGLLAFGRRTCRAEHARHLPMTTHLSRWYASGAIAGMLTIIAIALFALRSALAGQALFNARVLDD